MDSELLKREKIPVTLNCQSSSIMSGYIDERDVIHCPHVARCDMIIIVVVKKTNNKTEIET